VQRTALFVVAAFFAPAVRPFILAAIVAARPLALRGAGDFAKRRRFLPWRHHDQDS
jgi:hypothetical protein